jgi:CheY-like chemotaxis protein
LLVLSPNSQRDGAEGPPKVWLLRQTALNYRPSVDQADKLRIVVADDYPSIRENLRYLFDAEPDLTVVGVADGGTEALRLARELIPDVLVLDEDMPGGPDGLSVLRELRRSGSPTRVVLYTLSTDVCPAARESGAAACLPKDAAYDVVLDAVRAAGTFVLSEGGRRRSAASLLSRVRVGTRVLVVDDDDDIRTMLSQLLASEGYETRSVADGAEALLESERWQPDVIVLDLIMPRMGGREFVRAYRHVPNARARIVALSALPRAAGIARELGCDAGLAKPFGLEELLKTVSTLATA